MIKASLPGKEKSVRYSTEEIRLVKTKVRKYISYAIVFVVIYVLFFSGFFQVKYIEIVGNQAIDTTEIESLIWQSLDKNILLLFGRDNFWLLSVDYLLKNIATQYSFEDITITKKFPHTLRLQIIERLGRLVWQANDQYYVIDANGVITRQLAGTNLIEQADVPVVVDQANRVVTIGATVMSTELCASIIEAAEIYEQLITRPELSLDHFVVGEDQETLYKIITTSGLEIHLNDASSVQEQLGKLKRVLDSQSLKLAGISYINLRIKDQVIYK